MPPPVIVDYDPAWPERARQLLAAVEGALATLPGSGQFTYEHIGSTAVPGLAAKPIVDLQVRMPSLPTLARLAELLVPAGFVVAPGSRPDSPGVHRDTPRPGDPTDVALYEKRLFRAPDDTAILHIRRTDSPFAQFVVTFRDWLRANPDEASGYAQVKRHLARQQAGAADYDDYTRAKSAFFNRTDSAMRAWARNRVS